jgi:hypothetical protein
MLKKIEIKEPRYEKLSLQQKEVLRNKLITTLTLISVRSLIDARTALFTEEELSSWLNHFQTPTGKKIIQKFAKSTSVNPSFNKEEEAYQNKFEKNHVTIISIFIDICYCKTHY